MKKILAFLTAFLLLNSSLYAAGVAEDVILRDRNGNYLNINSDGTVPISGGVDSSTAGYVGVYSSSTTITGYSGFSYDQATGILSVPSVSYTGPSERLNSSVYGGYIDFNDDASNGVIRQGSSGNVNNEYLSYDYETTSNQVGISSGSGVTKIVYTSISLQPNGYNSSDGTAGATTTCTIAGLTSIVVKNGLIVSCS